MRIRHIDSGFGIRLALNAAREGNGLGLDTAVGIKRTYGGHTLGRSVDYRECPVVVIGELLHRYRTAETAASGQFASMVEEI